MKKLLQIIFTLIISFTIQYTLTAQVTVSGSNASSNGDYTSLEDAFEAIEDHDQTGYDISITITSDYAPTNRAVLTDGNWNTITVTPVGHRTLEGACYYAIFELRGADNVTIDGINDNNNSLTLINTDTENRYHGKIILFEETTTGQVTENNTITNCSLKGNNEWEALVYFDDYTNRIVRNITISNNHFEPYNVAEHEVSYAINASAYTYYTLQNINISGNKFVNFGVSSASSNYTIYASQVQNLTISSNKFYQTYARTFSYSSSNDSKYYNVYAQNTDGITATNNLIGYASDEFTGRTVITLIGRYANYYGMYFNTTGTTPVTISGNVINALSLNLQSPENHRTANFYGFSVNGSASSPKNLYINGNTIGSSSNPNAIIINTSEPLVCAPIYAGNSYAFLHGEFNNNTIGGINSGSTMLNRGASFNAMRIYTIQEATYFEFKNNTIGSSDAPITFTNENEDEEIEMYGININAYSEACCDHVVSGNDIGYLENNGTETYQFTGGIKITGIGASSASFEVSENIVHDISAIKGRMIGIYCDDQDYKNATISGNQVYNLDVGEPGNPGYGAYGIYYAGSNSDLFDNLVYNLGLGWSNYGMYFQYGTEANDIYNNIMILGKDKNGSAYEGADYYGIYETTAINNYYYNTVIVKGNQSSSDRDSYAFYRNATYNSNNVFKNNIFYNTRTNNSGSGENFSIRLGDEANITIDYNDYYSNDILGYLNGDKTTLNAWQAETSQDANSSADNPSFYNADGISPNDLVIGTDLDGTPISIDVDYFGNDRSDTDPRMGAIEEGGIYWSGAAGTTNWNTSDNWTGGSVPTSTESAIIPEGLSYYPAIGSGTGITCKNLTFNEGASMTINSGGSLITTGTVINYGTVNIKRSISANTWHLISIPTTSENARPFMYDYLQSWNEPTASWLEIVSSSTGLVAGRGYSLWGTGKGTYTFTGTPNNGTISQSLSYTENTSGNDGANLVGNPYPSSIDWGDLDDTYGSIYYWNGSAYVSWNDGVGSGSQYIPPMQGFFIVASSSSTFSMANNNRTHTGATGYYKESHELNNGLVLYADNGVYQDELWLLAREDKTDNFDLQSDAYKFLSHTYGLAQLYSVCTDGMLSIDVRPKTESIQLGFANSEAGTYSIAIKEIADISTAILEDTKLNIFHDLTQGAYTFDWSLNDDETRFKLHLNTTAVEEISGSVVQVYVVGSNIIIQSEQQPQRVILSDITGRTLGVWDNTENIPAPSTTGVYLVTVETNQNRITKKIIVK